MNEIYIFFLTILRKVLAEIHKQNLCISQVFRAIFHSLIALDFQHINNNYFSDFSQTGIILIIETNE